MPPLTLTVPPLIGMELSTQLVYGEAPVLDSQLPLNVIILSPVGLYMPLIDPIRLGGNVCSLSLSGPFWVPHPWGIWPPRGPGDKRPCNVFQMAPAAATTPSEPSDPFGPRGEGGIPTGIRAPARASCINSPSVGWPSCPVILGSVPRLNGLETTSPTFLIGSYIA